MQVNISARHGHLSEPTQAKIVAKVEKLARYFERLMSIDVIVDLSHEETPKVDINVSAEHKHDFVSTDRSTNLMASVDGAVQKVEQQLRKYKERVQERHRSAAGRHEEPVEPEADDESAQDPMREIR